MGLLRFLLFSLGVLVATNASKCVPAKAECRRYWVKLVPYEDLMESENELNSWCRMTEKKFSCIAATIISNCEFDAGRVHRYILKMTAYARKMCDTETSDDDVPPCKDPNPTNPPRKQGLSEVYYEVVDRLGIIPEQRADHDNSIFSNEETDFPVTLMDETFISEAISRALDSIDSYSSPEVYETTVKSDQSENMMYLADMDTSSHDNRDKILKTPIITEPFKGLLHYNYSGKEYALYWRQPNEFPVENVECDHLLPSFLKGVIFRCLLYRRLYDPGCIASLENDEPITPELIRDIDPDVPRDSIIDFGPRPYWMAELDEYTRQKELREQSTVDKFSEMSETSTESPIPPAACTSDTRIHEIIHNPDFKWWKCQNVFSEELRKEVISVLLPEVTENDIPLMSAFHTNNIAYVYLYEAKLHDFESIICARVNECHPRGRGVFKCTIKPREIKQCYRCSEETEVPSPAFDKLRKIQTAPSDSEPLQTDASTVESSGDSDYETSDNMITLLLTTDDTELSDKADDVYTEDIVAEEDELVAIDASAANPVHFQTNASSGFTLMIVDQDVDLVGDESESISGSVNEVDELTDDKGSDSTYKLSPDDYELHENVFLVQSIQPEDIRALYEMDNPEDDISQDDYKIQ